MSLGLTDKPRAAPRIAIITGAGSGIGRALAIELSREPLTIVAVSRRAAPLAETARLAPGKVRSVVADVSLADQRARIVAAIAGHEQVAMVVHAAGVFPIEPVEQVTPASWHAAMATNVDARLFLTTALQDRYTRGARVLFVGSMSATKARFGGAAYCVSQAASRMLQACLKLELADRNVLVTSAIPGPVDTPMLARQIAADRSQFPDADEYARLRQAGRLVAPQTVARFFHWLLTGALAADYTATAWDIHDPAHHPWWLGTEPLYPGIDTTGG